MQLCVCDVNEMWQNGISGGLCCATQSIEVTLMFSKTLLSLAPTNIAMLSKTLLSLAPTNIVLAPCWMLMVLWRLLLDQLQRSNSTSQSWKSLIGFFLACLPPILQASFPNIPNTFNIMSWGGRVRASGAILDSFPSWLKCQEGCKAGDGCRGSIPLIAESRTG